jgi:response regulator RpfG family c-di-GMP phosphodiesterase
LLGVTSPRPGGFDICRRLKSNPHTSDIPVIFIARGSHAVAAAEAYAIGAADWLNEPVQVAELLLKIGTQLSLSAWRKQYNELKRTETTLRKSEAQWRAVFDNNPIMYFMVEWRPPGHPCHGGARRRCTLRGDLPPAQADGG